MISPNKTRKTHEIKTAKAGGTTVSIKIGKALIKYNDYSIAKALVTIRVTNIL